MRMVMESEYFVECLVDAYLQALNKAPSDNERELAEDFAHMILGRSVVDRQESEI